MPTTATTYYEKNTASDLEWYAGQNSKFVARYIRVHDGLRLGNGVEFFSDLFESLGGSEYWFWCVLCGHQDDLRTVATLKTKRRAELRKLTKQRIRRVVGQV